MGYSANLPVDVPNCFGICLCIIMLGTKVWKNGRNKSDSISIKLMLYTTILSCAATSISFIFDGHVDTLSFFITYTTNAWLYFSNMIIGTLWVFTLTIYITGKGPSKWQMLLIVSLDVIGIAAITINFFKPIIFSISDGNIYQREALFWMYLVIELIFVIDGVILYLVYRKKNEKAVYFPVWQFVIPVLLGCFFQSRIYGISTIWPSIAIAICGVVLGLFNENEAEKEILKQHEIDTKIILEQKERLELQQKQLEAALDAAESSSKSKTTFLNNMSHDIRTPMNAIIGYTLLAEKHIDNTNQVENYLDKITKSSNHLLSLINDVLDMSRIESGKVTLDEKEESLSEIIHTLSDIVSSDVKKKKLEFNIETFNITNEYIVCDKLHLNQVLLNVISNAVKYTPEGGSITLSVKEQKCESKGYAGFVFSVSDTGIGMSSEFIKTIFEPFTRVKSSTVSGIQGTGLGMAITKSIVDLMAGNIDIRSEIGIGTDIDISFEFKVGNTLEKPYVEDEFKETKALIINSSEIKCIQAVKDLGKFNIDVIYVLSGREGINISKAAFETGRGFDICFIDSKLSDMDGIEVLKCIRENGTKEGFIPVFMGYDLNEIYEDEERKGNYEFLGKPVFPSDVLKLLRKYQGLKEENKEEAEICFEGKKILLVEDNELNREIATELLEEYGFSIEEAEDGDIAVSRIKELVEKDELSYYDLILMDVQMPNMNGYEATENIRRIYEPSGYHIPIIAMTANAFEEDRKAALDAGMDEHISKPVNIDKLKEVLIKFA